jgi:hypothetical protein
VLNTRASGTPLLFHPEGEGVRLERTSLGAGTHNEAWLQALAFDHPEVLPVGDIEPGLGELVPVAREVPLASGYVDLLYITPSGNLVLAEAKLWSNPQARREVVAQALDYVASLMTLDYAGFEAACCKGQGMSAPSLYALVADRADALEEPAFIDAVARNLQRGRLLVLAVGDGIRSETETLVNLLQSHAGAHFTFALVELATWGNPHTQELVVLPSTLARTVMITRGIVTIDEGTAVVKAVPVTAETKAATISEELYYEALAQKNPALPGEIRAFLALLEPLGIYPELKAALNLKADFPEAAGTINFGYINKNAKVWTDPLAARAPAEIAGKYNQRLADLIDGIVAYSKKGHSFVTTNGVSAPTINQLLPEHAQVWADAIQEAAEAIRELDSAGPTVPASQA